MARARRDRASRRSTRRLLRTTSVAALAIGGATVFAACEPASCTNTLSSASPSVSWDDPSAWSAGEVPDATDIACIGAGLDVELPTGTVTVKGLKTASTLQVRGSLAILNPQIQGASTARFILHPGSSITIGGGTGNLTLDGGELLGVGTVNGTASGATLVSPGDATGAPGILTVTGDVVIDGGLIPIDLTGDGKVAGTGHDQLKVGGAFRSTAGTGVIARPSPTFAPSSKTTMAVITATSEAGSPQVYDIPEYRGTGKAMGVSFFGPGLSFLVTDCDTDLFFPYWTYTSSLAGKDLRQCEPYTSRFDGIDLTGVDFGEAILWDSSFAGSNLTNANLGRADLGGSDLSTATLTGVRSGGTIGSPSLPAGWAAIGGYLVGPGANLGGAKLAGADLTGVRLAGARLTSADLSGADLSGVDLTGANLIGANLAGADLTGATLRGAATRSIVGTPAAVPAGWTLLAGNLIGPGANLSGADLGGLDLSGFDLTGANLTSARIGGTTFTGATFTRLRAQAVTGTPAALPTGWQVRNTLLVGPRADLSNMNLSNVNFQGIDLTGVDITGSRVAGTNLNTVIPRLRSGNLSGFPAALPPNWQLRGGYLVGPGADLSGKILNGTDLQGVLLLGADLTNAVFSGVNLTGTNLQSSIPTGIRGKGLLGAPAALPPNIRLVSGLFIGPNVNLSGETLQLNLNATSPYSLAGANLQGTTIVNSDLARVSLADAKLAGAIIADTYVDGVTMAGADLGPLPVGATFGSGLKFRSTVSLTPPAGWELQATGALGLPPYRLIRVS